MVDAVTIYVGSLKYAFDKMMTVTTTIVKIYLSLDLYTLKPETTVVMI